jgi:FlaA1/EpsC-like NDP-sugar epimerase
VLDMGKPVKILDLARQMIGLSGRTEEQVRIEFVGIRAGEKLHEVLWDTVDVQGPTSHPKIMRAARPPIDGVWLEEELGDLEHLVAEGDGDALSERLRAMIAHPRRVGSAVLEDTLH